MSDQVLRDVRKTDKHMTTGRLNQVKYGCDVSTPPLGQYCQVVGRPVEQLKNRMGATCAPAASQTTTRCEITPLTTGYEGGSARRPHSSIPPVLHWSLT